MLCHAWRRAARQRIAPLGDAIQSKVHYMKLINVTIKGTTPLLQQRFNEQSEQQSSTRRVLVARGTPREEAEKVCYRDKENRFYFPGAAISRLLREAGGSHKLKGSRKSAKFVIPAAVLVMDDTVLITNGDGGKSLAKDYEVDSRPVVIPSTKGRVMRHRPRFDTWGGSFTVRVNDDILPVDFIQTLLTEGGQQIGIGDFRPEKGGPFGTFNIVSWKDQA